MILMNKGLSADSLKFIISRVLENANEALEEHKINKGSEFYDGKTLAYYEVLDTIKNELETHDQDLKEYGLDLDLEKTML